MIDNEIGDEKEEKIRRLERKRKKFIDKHIPEEV